MIRYFVPRSNCSFGFSCRRPAGTAPGTTAPVSGTVILTSVSLPSLTFTPVALIEAPVEPFSAEITTFATEVLAESAPPLPSFLSSALALPPQAVRVRAPTTRAAQAPSTRRADMSGVVTGCSRLRVLCGARFQTCRGARRPTGFPPAARNADA